MEIKKLWKMVNNAEDFNQVNKAENAIRTAKINNQDFDELMMALSFIYREINRQEKEKTYKY
jgi:hypothetical protein